MKKFKPAIILLSIIFVFALVYLFNSSISKFFTEGFKPLENEKKSQFHNGTYILNGLNFRSVIMSYTSFQKYNNCFNTISFSPETVYAEGSSKKLGNEQLLARAVNGEARGEPYLGQVAVAAVILNRVSSSKFPKTISGVIYQNGAFTAVSDGQINVPLSSNSTVVKAARDALNGWDPTEGCLYYWNPATATNKWIWSRKIVKKIGKHNFGK